MKRKQAATPAKKRSKANLLQARRFGTERTLQSGDNSVNYRGKRPVSRCRSRVQARPGVPSGSNGGPPRRRSRSASAVRPVSGRSAAEGVARPRSGVSEEAPSKPRRAASFAANIPPALPRLCSWNSIPSNLAPSLNKRLPCVAIRTLFGRSASRPAQPSSSSARSRPARPRGRSSAAAACSLGSAGTIPSSSCSRRSRHHASLMAPKAGCVDRATTSAIASSMSSNASNAGRNSTGQ